MPATKILWGQIITVLSIVLTCIWGATEWVAWRLAFQPEARARRGLGRHHQGVGFGSAHTRGIVHTDRKRHATQKILKRT